MMKAKVSSSAAQRSFDTQPSLPTGSLREEYYILVPCYLDITVSRINSKTGHRLCESNLSKVLRSRFQCSQLAVSMNKTLAYTDTCCTITVYKPILMDTTHTIQKKSIVNPPIIAFCGSCQLFLPTCRNWSISVNAIKTFFSRAHRSSFC